MPEALYAVIGESEGYPVLYHMNKAKVVAELLRRQREARTSQPCFVVPMADWHVDPRQALRMAQGLRRKSE